MKVYIAVSTYESYDYEAGHQVLRVFARREDAEAYDLADNVLEFDVEEKPLEVRPRYVVTWDHAQEQPPSITSYEAAVDGREDTREHAETGSYVQEETWDEARAKALFEQKQREYEEHRDGVAASELARRGTLCVQVWYEPGDGNAILLTPLHTTEHHFGVPRDLITDQAGLPRGATLHGKWFEVETLTYKTVDGFSVAGKPYKEGLAKVFPRPVQPFRSVID
ncbi:hypothetical protein [Nonomuraea wenchangensis]|uniref:hypothetical protein n=1 Tax=Nonomuraea wenchangensis TaxID=568860 RepID=UPI00331D9329